jgi:hypothetical protein
MDVTELLVSICNLGQHAHILTGELRPQMDTLAKVMEVTGYDPKERGPVPLHDASTLVAAVVKIYADLAVAQQTVESMFDEPDPGRHEEAEWASTLLLELDAWAKEQESRVRRPAE